MTKPKFRYRDIIRWIITIGILCGVFIESGPWTAVAFLGVAIWMESIRLMANLFVTAVDKASEDIEDLEACAGGMLKRLDISDEREKWIGMAMQKGRSDGH